MTGPRWPRCAACPAAAPCVGQVSPAYCAQFRADPGRPRPRADAGAAASIAAQRLLIRSCDYRLDAVGLERGDGCGCTPATRCLLRRGKWPDDPVAVDYSDCLACVSSPA